MGQVENKYDDVLKLKCISTYFKLGLSCSKQDLVFWPGIEPGLPTSGVQSLSHGITREVPQSNFLLL